MAAFCRNIRSRYVATQNNINEDNDEILSQDSEKFMNIFNQVENLHQHAQMGMKVMGGDENRVEKKMINAAAKMVEKGGGSCAVDDGSFKQMELKMKVMKIHDDVVTSGNKNGATPNRRSAKARLHEICSMNHWKPPVFECCREQGPDHSKLFTFKVNAEIKIRALEFKEIECYGNSESSKKAAAESAAEGALWFLQQAGYQPKKIRP